MERTKFLFVLLTSILLFSITLAQDKKTQKRQILRFNDNWQFKKDNQLAYPDPKETHDGWENIRLPHDWSIKGTFDENNPSGSDGGFLPCGMGWYKKTFTVADSLKDKKLFIRFDGVYMNSKVWINGHMLGLYPYGYSTFQYDITPFLEFGKPNQITVNVDNSLQQSSRWYSGSGIYRNVWLIITEKIHLLERETFVRYQNVSESNADILLSYKVKSNAYPETKFYWWNKDPEANTRICEDIMVESTIVDQDGEVVQSENSTSKLWDFSEVEIHQQVKISNPKFWSAESPNLYTLHTKLFLDGEFVDDLMTTIGIRSIRYTKDQGLLVNDEKVKLKGVCLHHDAGALGAAVPKEMWRHRLTILKEMGCNAIRPSHCPFAPEFYDLCDEMGFYVMDEAFDEWTQGNNKGFSEDNFGKREYGYHKYFNQWAETDLKNMILRDRNHPSVIMYSIGNEIPDQRHNHGAVTAKKLVNFCHSLDSTRLVTAGVDFILEANSTGFLDALDIAGYNYVGRLTGEEMYDPEREKYPQRIYLGSETFHTTYYWLAVRDKPYVVGEFVWSGYDYLGEARNWPKRGWDAGIIDMADYKRPEFYLRKAYWTQEPIAHIAIKNGEKQSHWHPRNVVSHWNWSDTVKEVFVYSNCDYIELFLNDSLIGTQPVDSDKYFALFNVQYIPGELKAVGYRHNKKVTEHVLATSSEPVSFDIDLSRQTLTRNYDDIAVMQIGLTDFRGNKTHLAEHKFKVEVTGSGQLLGLESGDQFSHEPYGTSAKTTHNGRLVALIGYKESEQQSIEVSIADLNNNVEKVRVISLK